MCQLASRAAKEACCASLLEFSQNKRSRLRDVLANIVHRIPPSLNFDSLFFSAGPAQWSYDGTARQPPLRIQSARIALPDPRLFRLLGRLVTKVDRPVIQLSRCHRRTHCAKLFNVSMHQWRPVVRRMVRCKLAVALPGDTCSVQLSGWRICRVER